MSHTHNHRHDVEKNILISFFLNLFFVGLELVGGLWTNSIAILTDALHDFGDCLSLATVWFLQKKSKQGRDAKYSYGYKRFSLLGSVFLSGVLFISSIFIVIEAVKRLIHPQDVVAEGMLWLAVVGVVLNGLAALRMRGGKSLSERSVFLHIMEDALGWIAVLVVSVVMLFANIRALDPLLSIGISIWVLYNVYNNLRETFCVLLQAIPKDIPVCELRERLENIEGVCSMHDLHLWSLDGESHVMTLHVVAPEEKRLRVKEAILELAAQYNIIHVTIEFETEGTACSTDCEK